MRSSIYRVSTMPSYASSLPVVKNQPSQTGGELIREFSPDGLSYQ
jgi:hypothetical protein